MTKYNVGDKVCITESNYRGLITHLGTGEFTGHCTVVGEDGPVLTNFTKIELLRRGNA